LSLFWLLVSLVAHAGPPVQIVVGGATVVAEIAETRAERAMGLMGRAALATDHGMLFVYPDSAPRSFWMKNTPLPLSIAFLDATGRVVHMADMKPMSTEKVESVHPAMYALEMERGWFVAHQVQVGQRVAGLPSSAGE